MAWSGSAMFTQYVLNPLLRSGTDPAGVSATDITQDTIKAALYDSSITPNKDATLAHSGYAASGSQWLTSDEVTHANWPAGGIALANDAITAGTGYVMYDADNTTHSSTVTLSDVNGCLVYNDSTTGGTVVDQGITYHWFGGSQAVTAGTFTIVWHADGLFRITV